MDNKESIKEKLIKNKKIVIPVAIVILIVIITIIVVIINQPKVYKIKETAKIGDWEFTLIDVQYGKQLSESLSKNSFALPLKDGGTVAKEGNTFVVITYNLKYLGKENRNFFPGFKLDYNDGYIITNNSNLLPSLYIRNNVKEGTASELKNVMYKSLWDIENSSITFKPLDQKKEIREYIEVPDYVINNKNVSLKLLKNTTGFGTKNVIYKLR